MADREQHNNSAQETVGASQKQVRETGTRWRAWQPLRLPMFRNLLAADLVSDIGTFMQTVGAAWLMVSLGAGPMYVSIEREP